jgi:hypothetical protein
MNPLINAYNYKISQLQEQIFFISKQNKEIKNLLEMAIDPVDRHFPGWQKWGFDKELLKKYITQPGGGLTPAGTTIQSLWTWLTFISPAELGDLVNKQMLANAIKTLARYAYLLTPEQLSSLMNQFGLNAAADDLIRNMQRLASAKGLNDWLKAISETINPSGWRLVKNTLTKSRRGFTSTRLLAIIATLMAAGWAIDQILEYLNSPAGQNEEWPDGFIPEQGSDLPDRGSPELTPGETPQTPQIPSGNTPPSQMRPELPY